MSDRTLIAEEGAHRLEAEQVSGGVLVFHVVDGVDGESYAFPSCSIRARAGVAYVGGPNAPSKGWRPAGWGETTATEDSP